jgi:hypothetical protein
MCVCVDRRLSPSWVLMTVPFMLANYLELADVAKTLPQSNKCVRQFFGAIVDKVECCICVCSREPAKTNPRESPVPPITNAGAMYGQALGRWGRGKKAIGGVCHCP